MLLFSISDKPLSLLLKLILPESQWWILTTARAIGIGLGMGLEMGWEWECLEMAYSLSCCLEAGDKRINITANPDTARQCTQTSHQPLYFPHKMSLVTSLSAENHSASLSRNWRREIRDRKAESEGRGNGVRDGGIGHNRLVYICRTIPSCANQR